MRTESAIDPFDNLPGPLTTLRRVLGLMSGRNRRACALVLIANLCLSFVPAGMAYLTKEVVDRLFSPIPRGAGWFGMASLSPLIVAGIYMVLLVFLNLGQTALFAANEHLMETVSSNMHLEIVRRGLRIADLSYFDDPAFYNNRLILERNAFYAPVAVLRPASDLCSVAGTIFGMILVLSALHPLIPVLILLAGLPDFVIQKRAHRLTHESIMETAEPERLREYYRSILTTAEYANEVRLFNLMPYVLHKYREGTATIESLLKRVRSQQLRLTGGSRLILSAGNVFPYIWLVNQALHDRASIGQLAMYMSAILVIQQQLLRASQTIAGHQDLFSAMRVVAAWIGMTPGMERREAPGTARGFRGAAPDLALENVWFKYPAKEEQTLKGLTLHIPAGKCTAIVGSNGSGKSTIVKLLCRLYDPNAGRIIYNGSNLTSLRLDQLRKAIAVIFQDFLKYALTASENIALSTRTDDRIRSAMRLAANLSEADEVIRALPQGYDTLLSKEFAGGVELSGGQWQRIALARGLYRDADVLILDEPTAALDVNTEAKLYARFKRETAGKTTILISHRLSTVRMADQIAVVDDGKVVELGTHDALMSKRGLYSRMFSIQADRYRQEQEASLRSTSDEAMAAACPSVDLSL